MQAIFVIHTITPLKYGEFFFLIIRKKTEQR